MSEKTRGIVTMSFSDGDRFSNWESLTLTERYDDPLGSYSFRVRVPRSRLRLFQERLQKGELVGIQIDENPRATPIIDTVRTRVDKANGIVMDVSCTSVLKAASQASANPTIFKSQPADVPVEELILDVMRPFGFTVIVADSAAHAEVLTGKSIDTSTTPIQSSTLEAKDAQVQENETAYGYCARIFSRLGVALRVDWEGKLLIGAPNYNQQSLYTIVEDRISTTTGDRCRYIQLDETNDGQYSKVVVRGKDKEKRKKKQTAQPRSATRQAFLTGRFASEEAESRAQSAYESFAELQPFGDAVEEQLEPEQPWYTSTVQPFKPRYFTDKRSRDNQRCASFCKLVQTKNAPRAFMVTAEVDGLVSRSSGAIWAIDTVCRVFSDVLLIDDDMWVYETQMMVDKSTGSRTVLKLLPKGSLIIGDIPG